MNLLYKKELKQILHRLGQTVRVPEGWDYNISRQSAHKGGKVGSRKHRQPLSPRKYSWYSFVFAADSSPERQCGQKD